MKITPQNSKWPAKKTFLLLLLLLVLISVNKCGYIINTALTLLRDITSRGSYDLLSVNFLSLLYEM